MTYEETKERNLFKKFKNGKEMYDFLASGKDLYSSKLEIYVFEYNDAGALCYYGLSDTEVKEIVEKKRPDEYWAAYLGPGGSILDSSEYDDDEHRYSEDEAKRNLYLQPSIDFCNENYSNEDWIDTDDLSLELLKELSHEKLKKDIMYELSEFKDEDGHIYIPVDLDDDFYNEGLSEDAIKEILSAPSPEEIFDKEIHSSFYVSSFFDDVNSEEEISFLEDHLTYATLHLITELDFDLEQFINDYITFVPNIDKGRIKEQMVEIDILVDAGDMNYDFTLNSFGNGYYNNPVEGNFDENSSLVWRCKQQGVSEEDLRRVMTGGSLLNDEIVKIQNVKDHYEKKLGECGYDIFRHKYHKGDFAKFEKINSKLTDATKKIKDAIKRYEDNDISYEDFYKKNPNIPKVPLEKFEDLKSKCLRNAVETQIKYQTKREELEATISNDERMVEIAYFHRNYLKYSEEFEKMTKNEMVYARQKFVESVIKESAETPSCMSALTFLVKMPLSEAMEINKIIQDEYDLNDFCSAEKRTGPSTITLSKNSIAGLFAPWEGTGSGGIFDIELVKDVVLPVKYINSANTGNVYGNSVKDIFGEIDYAESLVSIDKVNVKEIDELIINAFLRTEKENTKNNKESLNKDTIDKEI